MRSVLKDPTGNSNAVTQLKTRTLLKLFEMDRAVLFGVLTKIAALCASPVTAILIATHFSPETQGYYYTFASLLALQVFVQLGLGTVIVQFASHEWSKLAMDEKGNIVGDRDALSRLISIATIAFKWFLVGGGLVALGLAIGGYFFFSTSSDPGINWVWPWISLSFVTGIAVCLVPVESMLEGCNQVARLYTFRFFQYLASSTTVLCAILAGGGLWTASFAGVASLLCSVVFLRSKYWIFLKTLLLSKPEGPRISWRTDMLPMQWRIMVTWASSYFYWAFFTPVLFKYQGPVVAGQMGMTWSLATVAGTISNAWIAPRAPQFGILIAQGKYADLDKLFWRIVKVAISVAALVTVAIVTAVVLLNVTPNPLATRLAARLLPPLPAALFMLGQLLNAASVPFSTYLRAHKKEPVMVVSTVASILTALICLTVGRVYSATGIGVGSLLVNAVLVPFVFVIWVRCRAAWHTASA